MQHYEIRGGKMFGGLKELILSNEIIESKNFGLGCFFPALCPLGFSREAFRFGRKQLFARLSTGSREKSLLEFGLAVLATGSPDEPIVKPVHSVVLLPGLEKLQSLARVATVDRRRRRRRRRRRWIGAGKKVFC